MNLSFGPFSGAFDELRLAGFECRRCGVAVQEARRHIAGTPWTMAFKKCECGGVVAHFVGDPGPDTPKAWKRALRLLKQSNTELLILNRNPSDAGSFGRN